MSIADWIIIAMLILWAAAAFISIRKRKKSGCSCCSSCSSCGYSSGCKSRKE